MGSATQILAELGLSTIRVLTNNPKKIAGIEGFGLTVVEQVPIEVPPNDENRRYLEAKRESSDTRCTTRTSASSRARERSRC